MYKFAAASKNETIVYGSARPGYSHEKVNQWIEFMHSRNVLRVCCLLTQTQLNNYANLLDLYKQEFGLNQVCWAPIGDFNLVDSQILTQKILPFLIAAQQNEKVVIHCSGGIGRTGQVLIAWLVHGRGFSNKQAISTVMPTGRNPYEYILKTAMSQKPWKAISQLNLILDNCRDAR